MIEAAVQDLEARELAAKAFAAQGRSAVVYQVSQKEMQKQQKSVGQIAVDLGLQIVDYIAEALGPKKAYAASPAHAAVPEKPYKMSPDHVLEQRMAQPVEETLKGTGVVYVDDSTFKREVYQEHLPKKQRKNVMVIFYNNNCEYGSKGNAASAKEIKKANPNLKFVAYRMSIGTSTPDDVRLHVESLYGVLTTPAIQIYSNNNGIIKLSKGALVDANQDDPIVKTGDKLNVYGGPSNLNETKWVIEEVMKSLKRT